MRAKSLLDALGVKPGDLVALAGGGGKTSLMYALAREARAAGLRTAVATTTKILPPPPNPELTLFLADSPDALLAADYSPAAALRIIGSRLNEAGKVVGVPPEWCDALMTGGNLDLLIVEGDGSRGLPLKAPGPDEPVIPAKTTLFVALVGLGCLGIPLGECAFRAELVAAMTRTALTAPVTPETVSKLLNHPAGLGKGRPRAARAVAFLNQADLADPTAARLLAQSVLSPGSPWERVAIGSLNNSIGGFELLFTDRR